MKIVTHIVDVFSSSVGFFLLFLVTDKYVDIRQCLISSGTFKFNFHDQTSCLSSVFNALRIHSFFYKTLHKMYDIGH